MSDFFRDDEEREKELDLAYEQRTEYLKSIHPVEVTRIRIPFGDMVVLYLQVVGAALIVFGIPALIFVLIRFAF